MIVRPDSGIFTPWWYTDPRFDDYIVTGSGAVWGDQSDATYVDFVGDLFSPMPTATFPATATTADIRTVFVRCQALSGTTYVGWELRDVVSGELFTLHSGADIAAPSIATDIEIPYDADNGLMNAALNAGTLSVTVEAMGGTGAVRIFEAWLELDDATVYGTPPLRQVQRGDGQGFSTAPRFLRGNSLRNFGFR